MRNRGLFGAAVLAALGSMGLAGGAEVVARDYPVSLGREFGYRMGRRSRAVPKSGNPAGTKLARKAAKGTLTICGIR